MLFLPLVERDPGSLAALGRGQVSQPVGREKDWITLRQGDGGSELLRFDGFYFDNAEVGNVLILFHPSAEATFPSLIKIV